MSPYLEETGGEAVVGLVVQEVGQQVLCNLEEVRDQGSGIRDQGSGIRDQGSGIRGQGSGIRRSR